jgi:hypothetical protein
VAPPADACASWIRDALRAHQRATLRDAHSVEGLDDRQERIAATRPLFETAAHGYRAWLDGCGGPDAYDVTYNLADALFRSGELRRAAVAFEEVRDWGWQRGRFPSAGSYALVASRLGAESRSRVLDEAIAAGTLVLPELAPTPTPSPPPEPVAALLLAREIHLSRFPDDDDTRASFSLADAALLERYGYWDEARTRYAAVIAAAPVGEDASLAAAGIVRMATALGDGAEVARVTALVPSVR